MQAPAPTKKVDDAAAAAAAEEEIDPTAYFANRCAAVDALVEAGTNPYPHKFATTTSVPNFVESFGGIEAGASLDGVKVAVAGRLLALRSSSSKLQFYTLHADGAKVQIMMNFEVRSCAGW
jgi:lysyl-tRNA synthetase class 2